MRALLQYLPVVHVGHGFLDLSSGPGHGVLRLGIEPVHQRWRHWAPPSYWWLLPSPFH